MNNSIGLNLFLSLSFSLPFPRRGSSGVSAQRHDLLHTQDGGTVPGHRQAEHGVQSADHQHPAQTPDHPECSSVPR